jgi:hypothetical protein
MQIGFGGKFALQELMFFFSSLGKRHPNFARVQRQRAKPYYLENLRYLFWQGHMCNHYVLCNIAHPHSYLSGCRLNDHSCRPGASDRLGNNQSASAYSNRYFLI